jgi:2'-5' RNA ligase
MLRLFAALPIPESVQARLAGLQHGLEGRLVAPESMHLTLGFFGEQPGTVAEDLHAALIEVSAPGFTLWLDGIGAFGNTKPHALYAAVRPEPALTHLQAKVVQAARRAGITMPSGRYVPHVTLARFSPGQVAPAKAAKLIEARAAFMAGPIEVDRFGLYRSDLGRSRPIYTELAAYPLRGGQR